jgi:hypothetical protein
MVDDFGVKYVGKEHAQHLIYALEADYTFSKDWTGGLYCGITLTWNYVSKHVDLSMPGYIKDAFHKFQHPLPKRPQYAPHNWIIPAYGQRIQYAPLTDAATPATSHEIARSQAVVDTLLYNARAVYPTLLVLLSVLDSQLSTATHSDASYLSEPKAKSITGGYFYLGKNTNSRLKPLSNGSLLSHTTVLKHVISSIAEAEFGALFVNAKEGTVTRTTLA